MFLSVRINQSIKIYIAPFQESYSEALPTQAKRKRTVSRKWWNCEQAPFGRCLRSIGRPFQVVGPTTEKEICLCLLYLMCLICVCVCVCLCPYVCPCLCVSLCVCLYVCVCV